MILCTIRKSDNTVIMTSFLRDSYVNIPGIRKGKLNTAYIYGGMDLLSDTILENFGVEIDNTVEVNFNGFMEIIDTMGGVDITLTKDEANYLNSRGNWGVFNERDWHLTEGVNTLNGSQALAYSRIRSIGTDFGRTERQRTVLQALIEKVRDLNLTELNNLVNSLVGLITTDMTNAEITGYVLEFFPMLKDLKIVTQRIPQNDTYHFSVISGVGDSIIMDFEKNRAFLRETLGD
jgi:LCP family protein required for cell wall assembly